MTELERAYALLQEWEQNATEDFKRALKRQAKTIPNNPYGKATVEATDIQFTPPPSSLLGRTRSFLSTLK